MAGKISELSSLTGAEAAGADFLETVDVSDTSMAASGTNKQFTLTELIAFLSANGGGGGPGTTLGTWTFDPTPGGVPAAGGMTTDTGTLTFPPPSSIDFSPTDANGIDFSAILGRAVRGMTLIFQRPGDPTHPTIFVYDPTVGDSGDTGNFLRLYVWLYSGEDMSSAAGPVIVTLVPSVGFAPGGGMPGQLLAKGDWQYFATEWIDPPSGGGGVPPGGFTDQALIKFSDNDGDAMWLDIPMRVPPDNRAGQVLKSYAQVDGAYEWANPPIPFGGTAGQVLIKNSDDDSDGGWGTLPPPGRWRRVGTPGGTPADYQPEVTTDTGTFLNPSWIRFSVFDKAQRDNTAVLLSMPTGSTIRGEQDSIATYWATYTTTGPPVSRGGGLYVEIPVVVKEYQGGAGAWQDTIFDFFPVAGGGGGGIVHTAENVPRYISMVNQLLTSGTIYLSGIQLVAGQQIKTSRVIQVTAPAGITHSWMALYQRTGQTFGFTLLGQSSERTTTPVGSWKYIDYDWPTVYTVPSSGWYFLAFMMSATTTQLTAMALPPSGAVNALLTLTEPIMMALLSGQTPSATAPSSLTAVAGQGMWVGVSDT